LPGCLQPFVLLPVPRQDAQLPIPNRSDERAGGTIGEVIVRTRRNPLRDSLSEQRFPHLLMFGLRMKPYAHHRRAE